MIIQQIRSMCVSHKFYCKCIKRILDFFFGMILFIILVIPMGIITVAVLMTEGRPVIFKQERVGQHGTLFKIFKFRTMIKNAEQAGPKSTASNDSRITKIGALLRKTSLDELPQVLNVIKGEMSFIGYRPDVPREDGDYSAAKYGLKPGITGYAQVNGRSSLNLEQAQYWENKYVEDISFVTDMKILLKTFQTVLSKGGAN